MDKPRHISPLYHPELHEEGFAKWLKEINLTPQSYSTIPELYHAYGNYRCDMEKQGISPNKRVEEVVVEILPWLIAFAKNEYIARYQHYKKCQQECFTSVQYKEAAEAFVEIKEIISKSEKALSLLTEETL